MTFDAADGIRPGCAICSAVGKPVDHPLYDNPQVGDQFHGQYDPDHPERIDAALAGGNVEPRPRNERTEEL